jgi:acetyltransferase-like isoleucine patch superfamily enzyme
MISNTNFQRILRILPNFLWPIKIILIKNSILKHGSNLKLGPNVVLFNRREIQLGENVYIGDGSIFAGRVPIIVGNNVMFGPQVMIRGGDHNFSEIGVPMTKCSKLGVNLPINIEDDVWIAARVIILKGITIQEGAVIGAGALVNKNILPYTINVGIPAKPISSRFSKSDLICHLENVRSRYSFEQIETIYNKFNVKFKSEKNPTSSSSENS